VRIERHEFDITQYAPMRALLFMVAQVVLALFGCGLLVGLLVLLPVPLAAGLVIGSATLLLACLDPLWAVGAALLAVPIQELVLLPGGLSFTWAAVALLTGSLGLHILTQPGLYGGRAQF
jgi:hypothetical protein